MSVFNTAIGDTRKYCDVSDLKLTYSSSSIWLVNSPVRYRTNRCVRVHTSFRTEWHHVHFNLFARWIRYPLWTLGSGIAQNVEGAVGLWPRVGEGRGERVRRPADEEIRGDCSKLETF